jgi:PII-like signaling protein
MSLPYQKITVYISEGARYHGTSVYNAILEYIRDLKLVARCIVNRGMAGYYENGEISTAKILDLSYNLPLTIEVILPAADLETVLLVIEEMVEME